MARTSSPSDENQPEEETGISSGGRRASRELITVGMEPATAIGILSIESAFSLSMAMMNAVVEQNNQWMVNRRLTIVALERLLRNDVLDEAVDSLLGGERVQTGSAHLTPAEEIRCPGNRHRGV